MDNENVKFSSFVRRKTVACILTIVITQFDGNFLIYSIKCLIQVCSNSEDALSGKC